MKRGRAGLSDAAQENLSIEMKIITINKIYNSLFVKVLTLNYVKYSLICLTVILSPQK